MAATANFTNKISLDDSNFQSGMRRVGSSAREGMRKVSRAMDKAGRQMRKVAAAVGRLASKLKNVAKVAALITFASAIAGAAAFTRGLKGAIDAGGKLSDLSARSGEAVSDLIILQEAFRQSGASGDAVGITLDRLTRRVQIASTGNNSYAKALDAAGLSADRLNKLSKADRFWEVARAFAAMEDKGKMTAAAMDLLDTSAGELFGLFSDAGALDKASVTIGSQAQLLEKNAALFDRISDLLATAGTKLQGFFVGVADVIAPDILRQLDKINKLDFAEFGQNLAKSFDSEKIITVLSAGLTYATAAFGNGLIKAVTGAAIALTQLMSESGQAMMKEMAATALGMQEFEMRETEESGAGTKMDRLRRIADEKDPRERKKVNTGLEKLTTLISNNMKSTFDQISANKTMGADVTGQADALQAFKDAIGIGEPAPKTGIQKTWALMTTEEKEARSKAPGSAVKAFQQLPDQTGSAPAILGELPKNQTASKGGGGNFLATLAKMAQSAMMNTPVASHMMKAQELGNAGFKGLSGLATMQAESAAGIDPGMGSNSIFAKDRKRLNIKSGLSTGGFGKSTKLKDEQAKEDKQMEPLELISKHTQETNAILGEALK